MLNHEAQLLEVLEKIGQPAGASGEVPAKLDADEGSVHPETVAHPDPLQPVLPAAPKVLEQPAPISGKNLFVHHDTHAVVYDVLLLKKYELDWFKWEYETLWHTIMQDFRVPSISDHAKSKIQAIRTLHINEWFWTKWEVFCWVCQALNNNIPDFQILQKPSVPQLFTAVDMASMVRDDEQFSAELQMFIAACMVDEGVVYAPEPVRFCQDEIENLLKSLKVEEILGTIGEVAAKWRVIIGKPSNEVELQETPVDVQIARLLVARDYLALRRRQMKDQLRMLDHGS